MVQLATGAVGPTGVRSAGTPRSSAGTEVRRTDPGPRPYGHAVAIGGGHGLSRTLRALPRIAETVTAIVTSADDGGSSGRLRRELDVLPPGDLRMALVALTDRGRLTRLLQYRFPRGDLAGHALGNLIIVALQDLHGGDLVAALDDLGDMLGAAGRVLPCTRTPVVLHADAAGGRVAGQEAVATTPRVERVWLEPRTVEATPEAVSAIVDADLVVIGPGSLYTSILPNLLVDDIAAALREARAPVAFVANLREQPGETEGMGLADHVTALLDHVPDLDVTALIAHDGPRPSGPGRPLSVETGAIDALVERVVTADLLDGADGHEPAALARVLSDLVRDP